MATYVALLRAVNVGGANRVAMTDLRAMFEALGMRDPRTVLQTGNVIFDAAPRATTLESTLRAAAVKRLGLDVDFFVRTAAEWRAAIAANPFEEAARADPGHVLIMPTSERVDAARLRTLRESITGRETVSAVGRELYLHYPDGIGRSRLTATVIERTLRLRGTARNWNTALKLCELLEERG